MDRVLVGIAQESGAVMADLLDSRVLSDRTIMTALFVYGDTRFQARVVVYFAMFAIRLHWG